LGTIPPRERQEISGEKEQQRKSSREKSRREEEG
jgi:hypothetical protein